MALSHKCSNKIFCAFLSPHARYITLPSPPHFRSPCNVWRKMQIVNVIIIQPSSVVPFPSHPNIILSDLTVQYAALSSLQLQTSLTPTQQHGISRPFNILIFNLYKFETVRRA
jgi:hypothetical protein